LGVITAVSPPGKPDTVQRCLPGNCNIVDESFLTVDVQMAFLHFGWADWGEISICIWIENNQLILSVISSL
jgi:hypothetical protein